ncbi:EAL domain, c-di-GMP-specific phosphodiesterase class I (or its enzymatically inactive variant) [Pseudidiomarina planktonica]|uniref:EAL domain, c-di-GMP-specific phosphodiesterase class I (Or its enzymatically inactive variant) n=1 Tax=Pseudidiomarina planktonica TaxID=1323738 RepID=A0A1Y6EEN7_9GAMM|nr:EAL domain-containing response regulator [Pseudidiomarina planktonica]RUO66351.1 diguanylate phosphodiesterase [Pseudidiomarina planktonica]SMQ58633.1 EAL domain, c-di-GMP-specific phosphodiesterase class I (or its enzymatically inactive variant) [Pseudidiomarina planktonica]
MEAAKNSGRLLVLDDEKDVASTICFMAKSSSFETDFTGDADVFMQKVRSWSPSHVIVDLQLADRDGIEVIHELAKADCLAAVVVMSGLGGRILDSSARAVRENGLKLLGTLSKPFSRTELLALLASDTEEIAPLRKPYMQPVSVDQLRQALNNNAYEAHFQPKTSCFTGKLVGFECLARWPQKEGGMIPPDQFISLAEQSGLINELTRQIYRYALANLPLTARDQNLKYALNLSPLNLLDQTFPRWLLTECQKNDISPSSIILEVTETASMDNPLALLESLTQFRIRGFQLSIDDFGVGYSSLVQLARLPFSELKIDQMFVKTLSTSEESQKIVAAVIGLGKSLGLNVVAEGVEDEIAFNYLRDLGCDEAQGYFIARPMDSSAASAWSKK